MDQATLKQEIEAGLPHFYGTNGYHRITTLPLKATDGIAWLAEKAASYWLIDKIAADVLSFLRGEEFLTIKVNKNKEAADDEDDLVVNYEDGNGNVLYSSGVFYTDFPLDSITFYLTDGVIMLTGEY